MMISTTPFVVPCFKRHSLIPVRGLLVGVTTAPEPRAVSASACVISEHGLDEVFADALPALSAGVVLAVDPDLEQPVKSHPQAHANVQMNSSFFADIVFSARRITNGEDYRR